MKNNACIAFACLGMFQSVLAATTEGKPAAPYTNPYLSNSTYPVTHGTADSTPLAGPTASSHRLQKSEFLWKPLGPVNSWVPIYSGPYPNGKRVIWVGGYDRVTKLDAESLEALTSYAIGGNTYFGTEETERHIAEMDKLGGQALVDYVLKLWATPIRNASASYRLLSKDNEFYMPHRAADGSISLQVYGEADASDPSSEIRLRREWRMPATLSTAGIMSVQMTSDGTIVMVTMDGTMIALARDFSVAKTLLLPSKGDDRPSQDVMAAFVRNGLSIDDHGGIYVVTRDYLHRVQWTGGKLSLDEADGAWSAEYPNEIRIGSGTSPALMGWGPKEDRLVVIADGTKGNNMMAFWRDEIPADWKGIHGMDRRVAGVTAVHFGVSKDEQAQVENALVVYGYGAFINNTYPVQHLPDQGGQTKQWLAESFYMNIPGHEAKGGTMIRWDPKARLLKTAWESQTNFVSTVCTVSGATETIYCWGARNGEWTLEGTNWNTGKSSFTYTLGKSQRFNPYGGSIIVAPNGAVDCGCTGGMGIVRVKPKSSSKQRAK